MIARLNPARRTALLRSCATVAIAASALGPQRAAAQSAPVGAFQGTITSSTNVSQTITTPGSAETITVSAPTATINWNATNNDFLPEGNVATFTSANGVDDYTVLNRITPVAGGQIQLNGKVISTLQGTEAIGGNVWFYAPGGIMVGANAIFDVGGLLLTSISPTLTSNDANGFSASFAQQDGDGGAIQIASGAQISALHKNSYVALVAPRIEQGGTVKVDGSAAYVAATDLTMTMNQGLFDIEVNIGTDDGNGIVHTGDTIGGAAASLSDNHKIYMVAVPKNQALTMLLGGTMGYDASVAGYENGQVVLGAGTTGIDDIPDPETGTSVTIWNSDSNLLIDNAHFTSDVRAMAMNAADVDASTGNVLFDGDLNLESFYGNIYFAANGFDLTVDGKTTLFTSPADFPPGFEGDSEDRVAGDIGILATNGGTITTGDLTLIASAQGQANLGGGDGFGGDGSGGNIDITADLSGTIQVNGNLSANASGYGGDFKDGSTGGGTGYGGSVAMRVGDGTIDVTGYAMMTASGIGGSYGGESLFPTTALGGNGEGGFVSVYSDGPGSITLEGTVGLAADGFGGNGQTGGSGFGGTAGVQAIEGTIALGPVVNISAAAGGGNAVVGYGGSGGFAQGGTAYIQADGYQTEGGTSVASTITGGDTTLDVHAEGGEGGKGDGSEIAAGTGGDAQGGLYTGENGSGGAFALIDSDGATLTLGDLTMDASALGGAGGVGGTGQIGGDGGLAYAGFAQAGTYHFNGAVPNGSATFGDLVMNASATGGAGGAGDNGDGGAADGIGGDAFGFQACGDGFYCGGLVIHALGSVHADSMTLNAIATGGAGSQGGNATGGGIYLESHTGGSFTSLGDVDLQASGVGGATTDGIAGDGQGGSIQFQIDSGSSMTLGGVFTQAGGYGGASTSGTAGNGTGGEATALITGTGSLEAKRFILFADGFGGVSTSGTGGSATGGTADLTIDGGGLLISGTGQFDGVFVTADAIPGGGATGGNSQGGTASLHFTSNGGSLETPYLEMHTFGNGGNGTLAGGSGTGGTTLFDVAPTDGAPAEMAINRIYFDSTGTGGNASAEGGEGGNATGGDLTVNFGSAAVGPVTTTYMAANGAGGNGTNPGALSGGTISIVADVGTTIDLGDATISASGSGGSVSLGMGECGCATGAFSASDLALNAGGAFTIGNLSVDGEADLTGGFANFYGTLAAPTITVTSTGLYIGSEGSLGVAGVTDLLTLNAMTENGDSVFLGDPGEGQGGDFAGWFMNNEGDIYTGALVINAVDLNGGASPDVMIYNVDIEGSHVGDVTVNTDGSIYVAGVIDFTEATAGSSLTLNAGEAIEVNTDTGGIEMIDSEGNYAGELTLAAQDIWSGDEALLAQLEEDQNFEGRDDALETNNGPVVADGYLRAGGITAIVGDSFFVQNSGTTDDLAGLTVGEGGLTIVSTSGGQSGEGLIVPAAVTGATVDIYGHQLTSDGEIQGAAFAAAVDTSGLFTPDSLINNVAFALPPPPPVVPPPVTPPPVTPPPVTPPPVTPPPVTPPPVTPPPVTPPPVTPPPVTPPPVTPPPSPVVYASDSVLGPLGLTETMTTSDDESDEPDKDKDDDSSDDDAGSVDASLGLINTAPVNLDQTVDDPITSGRDAGIGDGPAGGN